MIYCVLPTNYIALKEDIRFDTPLIEKLIIQDALEHCLYAVRENKSLQQLILYQYELL